MKAKIFLTYAMLIGYKYTVANHGRVWTPVIFCKEEPPPKSQFRKRKVLKNVKLMCVFNEL